MLLLVLALLPLGSLRGLAEHQLYQRFGAPVTIGGIERLDHFSLDPRVRITRVKIAQPSWAGRGQLAVIDQAVVKLPLLQLLRGTLRPESIEVNGLILNLVRDASGRANWEGRKREGKSEPTWVAYLTIARGRVLLKDSKRHMTVDAALTANARHGLRLIGEGTHRGLPMHFAAYGAAVDNLDPHTPYPFRLKLNSPLLDFAASGRMDHPFDLNGFSATLAARGTNIAYLDDLIEAGLPATQAFVLKASVRRDRPDWNIRSLAGTIGRSDVTGSAVVKKRNGRTLLDGTLDANRFDFDDLASDAGLARREAKRRAIGPRVIPATDIHLEKLSRLDGTLRVSARELLMKGSSPFRGFRGTVKLDHRYLTLQPLVIRLSRGELKGTISVDHRAGEPKLRVDLRQQGTTLGDMTGKPEDIDGPVEGRILLAGTGRDIRSALAYGSGHVALVMNGGTMSKKLAVFATGDLLKSLGQAVGGSDAARVPVNCVIAAFAAKDGLLRSSTLLIDTPVGRTNGTGSVSLPGEMIALIFSGRLKQPGPLQIAASLRVDGTLSAPHISIATAQGQGVRKRGLFGQIGDLLGSITKAPAVSPAVPPPVACAALRRTALR